MKDAVQAPVRPTPANIQKLFDASKRYAKECFMNDGTETDWYNKITETASNWLAEPTALYGSL